MRAAPCGGPWIWGTVTGALDRHRIASSLAAFPPARRAERQSGGTGPLIEAGRLSRWQAAQGLGVTIFRAGNGGEGERSVHDIVSGDIYETVYGKCTSKAWYDVPIL